MTVDEWRRNEVASTLQLPPYAVGLLCPAPNRRRHKAIMSDFWRLTCLSRTSGLSREQRGLGRIKLAQRYRPSHTWLGHHFQGQKVKGQGHQAALLQRWAWERRVGRGETAATLPSKYANTIVTVVVSKIQRRCGVIILNNYSVDDDGFRMLFYDRLASHNACTVPFVITIHDVLECACKRKTDKAVGLGGIAMEAIVNGGLKLAVHLSILFNLFLTVQYFPSSFMQSVIIPLRSLKVVTWLMLITIVL